MEEFKIVGGGNKYKHWRYISVTGLAGTKQVEVKVCVGTNLHAEAIAKRLVEMAEKDFFPVRTSVEVADADCESQYIPIKFEFQNWNYVFISYEQLTFLLPKKILIEGCHTFLSAQYEGMGI